MYNFISFYIFKKFTEFIFQKNKYTLLVFLIAEIGVNWDGDFDLLKTMLSTTKKSGCNAVKFQSFTEEMVKNHPQKSRLMKSTISQNNVEKIDMIAKTIGIEWFCTPMYPEAVDFLNPFVKRFKIREFDGKLIVNNQKSELFETMYKTGKEIIISSHVIPTKSNYYLDPKIKWLYCVPKYPSKLEDVDFSILKKFDGYSNHNPQSIVPITAAILGAKIIELHITSDKSQEFIDNNVSFNFNELEEITNVIHQIERIKL